MNTPKKYAVLAEETGNELITRLSWTKLKPRRILELGCEAGEQRVRLSNLYTEAQIFGLDRDVGERVSFCAEATDIPLANQTIDLLFANLILPLYADHLAVFRESRRILRAEGLFTFATLGPKTGEEWQGSALELGAVSRVDMHDIGDALVQTGFADPVLDVDYFTFSYKSAETFWRELTEAGILPEEEALRQQNEKIVQERAAQHQLTMTFEVVYGHAWAPAVSAEFQSDDQGTVNIPLSHLRRRRTG